MMGEKKVLAEELIKVSKKFRRLFLEQTVGDLGEVPAEPVGGEGEEEIPKIDVGDLEKEAYGDSVQEIVSAIEGEGIENVEAEGVTTFVVEKDGKKITFEVTTIEGEPVVVIYTEEGRLTVSLAPLIGYVTAPEDAVDKLAGDEGALEEFSDLVGEVVGVEGVEEVEEPIWVEGEEPEEEEPEEEEPEEEPEEEVEIELEGEIGESKRKEKKKGVKVEEQATEYDMASGRRDITIGVIQDSGEKIGSVPVKTIDITKGVPKLEGEGKEDMAFPNLYALFRPKEGLPDVQGFVSEEIKQSEEKKEG
jgi:hypothetical protein